MNPVRNKLPFFQRGQRSSDVDSVYLLAVLSPRQILQKNPGNRIVIFWDGAAYNKRKKIRKFLSECNEGKKEKDWKITFHVLALCTPK